MLPVERHRRIGLMADFRRALIRQKYIEVMSVRGRTPAF
jgi:hypothetical protein